MFKWKVESLCTVEFTPYLQRAHFDVDRAAGDGKRVDWQTTVDTIGATSEAFRI